MSWTVLTRDPVKVNAPSDNWAFRVTLPVRPLIMYGTRVVPAGAVPVTSLTPMVFPFWLAVTIRW